MNSKECLNAILDMLNYEQVNECDKKGLLRIIKQDLDKLEQLEKEKQEVETRLSSKETNTFDEIATMIKKANSYDVLVNKCKQLEKALDILKDRFEIKGVKEYLDGYVIDTKLYYIGISQEEYELLKEVFE